MKITDGIEMLELQADVFGNIQELNPTLLWNDKEAVLIDTGIPGQFEQLRDALIEVGVDMAKLKAIIVTHQDIDHIGNLPVILQHYPEIKIYAHEMDAPYIEGERPLLKLNLESIDWQMQSIPEPARKQIIEQLQKNPPKVKVDKVLKDKEELSICGGIVIIHTPGHTPGHISLYLKNSKVLVAGDSMYSINGEIIGPHPETTPQFERALKSLKKYKEYDIESVICYHGGFSSKNIKEQLEKISNKIQI